MLNNAILLNGQWIPCSFSRLANSAIPVPGPNGTKSWQPIPDVELLGLSLPEMNLLLKTRRIEIRQNGEHGFFLDPHKTSNGISGYLDWNE